MTKIIRTKKDYEDALKRIEALIDLDPEPGTPESDELQVLSLVLKDYETNRFPTRVPDPLDAIRFRMEQGELLPRDLVPYLGSRSKVSEVLSGKRRLTLSMIRALHAGLGIPASALLEDRASKGIPDESIDWSRFPIQEMLRRGWIRAAGRLTPDMKGDLVRRFFASLPDDRPLIAMYRQTVHIRSARNMDTYALAAWTARVVQMGLSVKSPRVFTHSVIDLNFMRHLVRLSLLERGPLLAQEMLAKHGIALVIEPRLPGTYIDGAAILSLTGNPIIALTLRHDRVDNFWFCLMHELAHVVLHSHLGTPQFYDDIETSGKDPLETEADTLASESLVPEEEWRASVASRLRSPEAVQELSGRLGVHPAIVAGKVRHQFGSYRVLSQLVGHGEVRRLFSGTEWR